MGCQKWYSSTYQALHIRKYGRLLYIDLLMYMDTYINIIQAIFSESMRVYHNIYKRVTYLALNTFPNNILFQDMFGKVYSWADAPEKQTTKLILIYEINKIIVSPR